MTNKIVQKIKDGLEMLAAAVVLVTCTAFLWALFIEPNYLQNLADSIPGISSIK